MRSWLGSDAGIPSGDIAPAHRWCTRCDDTGDVGEGFLRLRERAYGDIGRAPSWSRDVPHGPCPDCPTCAVCRAPFSQHDPGVDVRTVVTEGPYGTLHHWQVARGCTPIGWAGWVRTLHLWELWTGAVVRQLDVNTGVRRGPGARVL